MHWKKTGKIALYVLFGVLMIIAMFAGYFYYQFQGKYDVNEEKYAHSIGYLTDLTKTSKFQRCDENRTYGWFASAATYGPIFKGDKPTFRKNIKKNYIQGDSSENGFLNLRFVINCKGDVGHMETNELDPNYNSTKLSKNLVKQLVELTSRNENWIVQKVDEEPIDSYMYLIYKIENGKIVEILP